MRQLYLSSSPLATPSLLLFHKHPWTQASTQAYHTPPVHSLSNLPCADFLIFRILLLHMFCKMADSIVWGLWIWEGEQGVLFQIIQRKLTTLWIGESNRWPCMPPFQRIREWGTPLAANSESVQWAALQPTLIAFQYLDHNETDLSFLQQQMRAPTLSLSLWGHTSIARPYIFTHMIPTTHLSPFFLSQVYPLFFFFKPLNTPQHHNTTPPHHHTITP